ncbi:MAG TPA: oligosaccharide flippase family protein [Bryobacteraceae bacterium]|nr:oligosaccharide flippase family protein [Bryobacteraceae bacterium]
METVIERPGRTRRFLDGVWLSYAYQGLVMIVGLWLTPFLLHRIGQHDLGVWMVATQLLMYLALVDVGVLTLLPRETAYMTGRAGGFHEAKDLPLLIGEISQIVLLQSLVAAIAAVCVWFLMPASWHEFRGLIGIILAAFVLVFPLRIFQGVLQGLQDLKFLGRVQIATWTISTVTTIALVLKGFGLYALAIGWVLSQFLSAILAGCRLWTAFPMVIPRSRPKLSWHSMGNLLSRGLWITVSQLAVTLGAVDVLFISKFFGASAVVPYACTLKLALVFWNQPLLMMQAAEPGLSELKTGASKDRIIRPVTALTQAILMLSGLLGCVVIAVNRSFVSWWVGPTRYIGLPILLVYVLNMLARHWNIATTYTNFCFGYERRICFTTLSEGILTAGSSYLLIWWLGPIGAPAGMLVGVLLIALPVNLLTLRSELGVSMIELVKPLWPWFWRFVPLCMAAIVINLRAPLFKFPGIVALSTLVGLAYAGIMFRPGQDSALGTYLMPQLRLIWKRLSPARSVAQ